MWLNVFFCSLVCDTLNSMHYSTNFFVCTSIPRKKKWNLSLLIKATCPGLARLPESSIDFYWRLFVRMSLSRSNILLFALSVSSVKTALNFSSCFGSFFEILPFPFISNFTISWGFCLSLSYEQCQPFQLCCLSVIKSACCPVQQYKYLLVCLFFF